MKENSGMEPIYVTQSSRDKSGKHGAHSTAQIKAGRSVSGYPEVLRVTNLTREQVSELVT